MDARRFALRDLLPAALIVLSGGCATPSGACTEIACEDRIIVDFSVAAPPSYWFEIDGDGVLLPCNIPDQDPPDEAVFTYDCGASGLQLVGPPDVRYSLSVTLYDPETLDVIVPTTDVPLTVDPGAEPIAPNGVDCPPVCYERFGTLLP